MCNCKVYNNFLFQTACPVNVRPFSTMSGHFVRTIFFTPLKTLTHTHTHACAHAHIHTHTLTSTSSRKKECVQPELQHCVSTSPSMPSEAGSRGRYTSTHMTAILHSPTAYSSGQKKGLVPYSLNDRTDAALRF